MTTDQTNSVLWLWVLQVAWSLAYLLPLAAAFLLVASGFRWLHRRARDIEARPVEAGPGGLVNLLRNKFSHMAIGQSMLYLIIGGLALGGMLGLVLQGLIQPEVQKVSGGRDFMKPEAAAPSLVQGDPIGFILVLALVLGALTFGAGMYTHRALRQRATEAARHLTGREPSRPLLIKWFHDSKLMGVLAVAVGGFVCFSFLIQLIGLIVFVIPLPESLTNVPWQWATNTVMFVLAGAACLLFVTVLAASAYMALRHFKLETRYYRENPTFRMLVNVWIVLGAGTLGALLDLYFLTYLGEIFLP